MGDITLSYYLYKISMAKNKNHFRIRNMIKIINTIISQYRITARKFRGYTREYCNSEANYLEKRLDQVLGSERRKGSSE